MSSEALFWIAVAGGIFWVLFSRDKEKKQKSSSQVVKPSTNTNSETLHYDNLTLRKSRPPSTKSGSQPAPPSSSQHQQVFDIDNFSNSGETVWKGSCSEVSFEYVDSKGVITKRRVNLNRYFRRSGIAYLSGQCRLRQADRCFKTSRIGDTISIAGKQISKQKFLYSLRADKISSLVSDTSKNKSVAHTTKSIQNNHSPAFPTKSKLLPQQKGNKIKKINWRKEGLLSIRGYRVGKTKGLPIGERHSILENILMRDGLNDVDDTDYAAAWGQPASQQRFNKLSATLKSLADIAEKRSVKSKLNLNRAISDWRTDLGYLESLKSRLTR